MKKCSFCSKEIQDDAIKCRFCGEFLNKSDKLKIKWYYTTSSKVISYIADCFRYSGKQMLSDIIKWTIIIIITTVVFVTVYKIGTGLPFQPLPSSGTELIIKAARTVPTADTAERPTTTFNRQQQNPISMIEDEVAFGQEQINRQFDLAKYELDQRTYKDPKEYIQAINELRQQTAKAGLQLRQKSEAKLLRMQQIMKLVEEGKMPKQAGQRALWRIAGMDEEVIDVMFPKNKPRNLMQEHADEH
ncbi:MAG: hypothetical protein A2167_03410 [Planctomycetes bacterium RBG_13_46_10]|nr:MAG: hypothetical protein A2167_03410 [Planctomycetes bacterium RBG_13_46_10]